MSLILDALNKADRERNEAHAAPNLQAVHGPTESSPKAGLLKRWAMEILIAALLIAAWFIYPYFTSGPAPYSEPPAAPKYEAEFQTSTAEPASIAAQPPEHPLNQPTPGQSQKVTTPPPPLTGKAPGADKNALSAGKKALSVDKKALSADNKTNNTGDEQAIISLYNNTPDAASADAEINEHPEAPATTPTMTETVSPLSQQQAKQLIAQSKKAELRALPLLSQLSRQTREAIPNIHYSVHVYSREQGTGFATLNNRQVRPGSQVAPGLTLTDITDEFIVLNYQGTRFRLGALNSWVNFD